MEYQKAKKKTRKIQIQNPRFWDSTMLYAGVVESVLEN